MVIQGDRSILHSIGRENKRLIDNASEHKIGSGLSNYTCTIVQSAQSN